jgi:hypothetical protein
VGLPHLRPGAPRPARVRRRSGALPRRAGRRGGRRPPRARRPRLRGRQGGVRGARAAGGRRGGDHGAADPPRRQRVPAHPASARRSGDDRRRGRRGHVRGGHAGPGLPRPGVGAGRAERGRRNRAVRGDPVAARGPRPDRRLPQPAPGEGAALPRRHGRRLRRARGPVHADPRLPARPRHPPAGEDGLLPRGVVLRPRPPAPGEALVPPPRPARRHAGQRRVADGLRRRRVHVVEHRGHRQRDLLRRRAVLGAEREGGRLRGTDEQPAVRRDARLRRGADLVRRRGADGQARRRARHGPGPVPSCRCRPPRNRTPTS